VIFCGECGAQNRDGAKFCTKCGSTLDARCPSCGAMIAADDVFCGECGTNLQAPTRTRQIGVTPPAAERRLVSVLFADLEAFTSYSEERDPEEVRDLLGRYFEVAREIVGRYGGVVEKFIGDAVMAVWGTPVAREDDTERSVRAALELVTAVANLGRELGAPLKIRAGIHSGGAAVTVGAEGQGMVAGDMVNTAARLQSVAEPGSVLVDRKTFLGAKEAVAFESVGELQLKGKEELVAAWRALRVVGARRGFRPGEGIEPPFTGREDEFRLIKELLHSTMGESRPHLASILGIAGIGKSRLIWEFFKYIDGLSDEIYWHVGRSPAYGEGIAYWALAGMVRMRARIAETDDTATARAKLADSVSEFISDSEERLWIEPRLAGLLGLEDRETEDREQLFAAWRTFFERIAQDGPMIMVFEDLQWADPGLVDFVEHLLSWVRNSPILVITLARPEFLDRRPTWGAGQRSFTSIHLDPLDPDRMRELIKGLVDGLPQSVTDEIVDRAEGVPLYAVEMVRMLVDRGQLEQVEQGYVARGDVEAINVPDSLHALIASRLDVLPTDDRLLVQDASVLGKTFTKDSLAAVTPQDTAELDKRLRELTRREILTVDIDPRSPERGQYGFVQSLIREVAYQTLSSADRRDRHVKAAKYFSALEDLDLIDVVATHYLEAYRNSPKDADGLAAEARHKLVEAAERALSLASHEQALALYEKALSLPADDATRGHLLYLSGDASRSAGRPELAVERLEEAIAVLGPLGDKEALGEARASLGHAYFLSSRVDEAISMLEGALSELDDPDVDPVAPPLYSQLARVHVFAAHYDEALDYTERALGLAEKLDDLTTIADLLITRAIIAIFKGRAREARAILTGVLRMTEDQGLVREQLRTLINLSASEMYVHPRYALASADKCIQLARRFGYRDSEFFGTGNFVDAAVQMAEWERGESRLAEAEEWVDYAGGTATLADPVAMFLAYRGNFEAARDLLARTNADIEASTSMQDKAYRLTAELVVAHIEGDLERAFEWIDVAKRAGYPGFSEMWPPYARAALWAKDPTRLRDAIDGYKAKASRGDLYRAQIATMEAGVLALERSREEAVEAYLQAIQQWRELDIPLGLAHCQLDFAVSCPDAPEAAAAAAEATRFFSDAGTTPLVRRLQQAIPAA
jgi:class 3 adenylate cyclase/tetratricopeptide (TPR) repeat protein